MRQERNMVILGMGYLMEYIYPCYKHMLREAAGRCMTAVTLSLIHISEPTRPY